MWYVAHYRFKLTFDIRVQLVVLKHAHTSKNGVMSKMKDLGYKVKFMKCVKITVDGASRAVFVAVIGESNLAKHKLKQTQSKIASDGACLVAIGFVSSLTFGCILS